MKQKVKETASPVSRKSHVDNKARRKAQRERRLIRGKHKAERRFGVRINGTAPRYKRIVTARQYRRSLRFPKLTAAYSLRRVDVVFSPAALQLKGN